MNPHLAELERAHARVFGASGYLEQARAALGNGQIGQFIQNLLNTLGPIVGPIIVNYLLSLLHLPGLPPISGAPTGTAGT